MQMDWDRRAGPESRATPYISRLEMHRNRSALPMDTMVAYSKRHSLSCPLRSMTCSHRRFDPSIARYVRKMSKGNFAYFRVRTKFVFIVPR